MGAVSGVRVEPECSPQLGQRGRPWEAQGQLEGAGPCWDVQAVAAGSPSIHPLWPFGTATGTLATVKGRPPLHTHWLSPEQLSSVALRRVSEGSSFVPKHRRHLCHLLQLIPGSGTLSTISGGA